MNKDIDKNNLKAKSSLSKFLDNLNRKYFRLSVKEKILFAKRLAILLRAGVPIMQSLNMLKEQSHSKATSIVLQSLCKDVEHGQSVHASLNQYKKAIGEFALNLIRIGEISGTLADNLDYLAEELKKKQALRRKVIGALVYPVFIVFATLGITVMLTVYVFPKILPIIQSLNADIPWTTRVLMFLSNFFIHDWMYILGIIVLFFIAFLYGLKKEAFILFLDRSALRVPLIGRIFQGYHISNICRSLGILLKSDVRIVESINVTARTTTNLAYQKQLEQIAIGLSKGGKISDFTKKDKKLFPPMVSQMVEVGESTGHLSQSLLYVAQIYEDEVEDLTKNLSTVIEPVLMVFMGILVGFVAISIITPIYGITQHLTPYK